MAPRTNNLYGKIGITKRAISHVVIAATQECYGVAAVGVKRRSKRGYSPDYVRPKRNKAVTVQHEGNRIAVSNQPIITPGPDANPCSYGSDLVEGTRVTFEIMVRVPSVAKSNAYLFMCLPGNLLVNPTIISAECMIDGVLSLTAAVHPDVNEVFIPLGDLQPNTYLLLSLRMDITDDIENGQYNLIRFFSVIYD